MATEMITLKLDDKFLHEIDQAVKQNGFHSRTEFIRQALREKIQDAQLKKSLQQIAHLQGASKKKITPKQYELARNAAFDEIAKSYK